MKRRFRLRPCPTCQSRPNDANSSRHWKDQHHETACFDGFGFELAGHGGRVGAVLWRRLWRYDRGIQRDYRDNGSSRSYGAYRGNGWTQDRYQTNRWDDRSDYHSNYRSHNNDGALVGLGIGLFALGVLAASSQHHDYHGR